MIPGDAVAIDGVIRLNNVIEGETIGSVIRLGQNTVIQPLDVAENGTYEVPEGVEGFNPVRVDTGFVLLASINPQVNQKNCKIDLDNAWLSKYKHFMIICDIRITSASGADWIYYTFNSQLYLSGKYYGFGESALGTGRLQGIVTATVDDNKILLPVSSNVFAYSEYDILPSGNFFNIAIRKRNYDEGTTIKLYGIS